MVDSLPDENIAGVRPVRRCYRQFCAAVGNYARMLSSKEVPVLFIILFCILLWGGQYVFRHLWEPDEARFTYISREMSQRGSWMVPYRDGEFYAHKPPLMFWLINAGTLLTGGRFNQVAGRLPSLLGAILALWAISRIAASRADRPTAWRTLMVLCTSSLFWQKGGMGQIDMLLLGLELTALHLLLRSDDEPAVWSRVVAFIFMGLAVLAKGPVGLIVPIGIYVGVHLAAGRGRTLIRADWFWGLPLALALPGLWLLAAKWSGAPDAYFKELFFDQNLGRLAGKFGGHKQPFYYFFKYLPLDFLPWTFFVPISILQLWKDAAKRRILYQLGAWVGFVVLFFSLSGSKRNLYILSAYPALSLMVAMALPRLSAVQPKWQAVSAYFMIAVTGISGLAVLGAPFTKTLPVAVWPLLIIGTLFTGGSLLLLVLFLRHGLAAPWFNAFISFFISVEIVIGAVVMPAFNPVKTPVALADAAQIHIPPDHPLLLFDMIEEILPLYCKRQGFRIDDTRAMVVKMDELQKGIVVFHKAQWPQLKDQFQGYGPVYPLRVGSQQFVWMVFNTPGTVDTIKADAIK